MTDKMVVVTVADDGELADALHSFAHSRSSRSPRRSSGSFLGLPDSARWDLRTLVYAAAGCVCATRLGSQPNTKAEFMRSSSVFSAAFDAALATHGRPRTPYSEGLGFRQCKWLTTVGGSGSPSGCVLPGSVRDLEAKEARNRTGALASHLSCPLLSDGQYTDFLSVNRSVPVCSREQQLREEG